jgi:AraC-like DNA-binding protein
VTSLIISELVDASTPPSESDPADQILAYCMTRPSDPSLCVDSIAQAHRISVRYLHKLFQALGLSLAAWIRHQRLQDIRRDLPTRRSPGAPSHRSRPAGTC